MKSLTDFQTALTLSLRGSQAADSLFVAITLDEDRWLIDLSAIQEASVPPRIAHSLGAPEWVLGIGNFKGKVWSVLDMRMILHGKKTFNPRWGWVTLLRPNNAHEVALLWSEIVEIAPQSQYTQAPVHEVVHPWSKAVWTDKRGEIWNEFNIENLLGSAGVISAWVNNGVRTLPAVPVYEGDPPALSAVALAGPEHESEKKHNGSNAINEELE